MSRIRRHNRCRGICVWRWKNFQIEVWFIPRGERIEEHIHRRIDSTIRLLWGRMLGHVEGLGIGHVRRFKGYAVPRGVAHSAVAESFVIFMNAERWTDEVTSAAEDFSAV